MDVRVGVVKEVPVPKEIPPVGTLYQFIVPDEATAPSVTVPESQPDAGVVEVIDGEIYTVAIIAVLVVVVQLDAVAST